MIEEPVTFKPEDAVEQCVILVQWDGTWDIYEGELELDKAATAEKLRNYLAQQSNNEATMRMNQMEAELKSDRVVTTGKQRIWECEAEMCEA